MDSPTKMLKRDVDLIREALEIIESQLPEYKSYILEHMRERIKIPDESYVAWRYPTGEKDSPWGYSDQGPDWFVTDWEPLFPKRTYYVPRFFEEEEYKELIEKSVAKKCAEICKDLDGSETMYSLAILAQFGIE